MGQTQQRKVVGLVGVGRMGTPMMGHALRSGFPVVAYDPADEARARITEAGGTAASSPAEVGAKADVTIVLVGLASEVQAAVLGETGVLAGATPGKTVVVSSTISPQDAIALSGRCADAGLSFLDAPIARGERGAIAADVLWLVGGDEGAFTDHRDVMETCGDKIYYLGPAGSGMVGKSINNMLLWAALSADTEAIGLARKYGVDEDALVAALLDSSGTNWILQNWHRQRNIPWAHKDMRIIVDMADQVGMSVPLAGLLREQVKELMQQLGFDPTATLD